MYSVFKGGMARGLTETTITPWNVMYFVYIYKKLIFSHLKLLFECNRHSNVWYICIFEYDVYENQKIVKFEPNFKCAALRLTHIETVNNTFDVGRSKLLMSGLLHHLSNN